MNHPKTVVSFSIFKGSFFGHGGEKGTKQIEDLVSKEFNYQLIQCPYRYNKIDGVSIKDNLWRGKYAAEVLTVKSNRKNFSLKSLLKESSRFYSQEKFLVESEALFQPAQTVIWENTFPDFFHMAALLKQRYSKRVIACPHNLESLIPHQRLNWFGKNKIEFLEQELEVLQLCDEVLTISEEEEWLLNLFGIRAKYLPYYPLAELFESLLEIRKHRSQNERGKFYLILGSVNNPPTKPGMVTLLNAINKITTQNKISSRYIVTGYGTEQLSDRFRAGNVDILGYTDTDTLNKLMKNCIAMIVSQDHSTGALTKIPEMLIAGIPVIANHGGSRTYRRTEGVFVYNSEADFAELISHELPMPPVMQKPAKYFDALIEACHSPTS